MERSVEDKKGADCGAEVRLMYNSENKDKQERNDERSGDCMENRCRNAHLSVWQTRAYRRRLSVYRALRHTALTEALRVRALQ